MTAAGAWNPPVPVLCLVTPGVALSGSASSAGAWLAALRSLVEQAVRCGVDLVQIREPDLLVRDLTTIVGTAVTVSRGSSTRILVNDRLDVAISCGADGVHLGSRSLPPARVRAVAPAPFLIGRSIHTVDEATSAAGDGSMDYLIAGTVFRSASKPPGSALLGVDGLSAIVRAAGRIPVLAIGGIDLATLPAIASTGVRGFAAIRFFTDAAAGSHLCETVSRARAAFDTTRTIP